MSTDFLKSLTRADQNNEGFRICNRYLSNVKRIDHPERRCLGYVVDGDARFYYYRLADGVLEFEVIERPDGRFDRRVTDFITDPSDVYDMLGDETEQPRVAPSSDAASAIFRAPS